MKVVIAIDKFKNSISAKAAATALAAGLTEISEMKILAFPMADGGDGLLETVKNFIPCQIIQLQVLNPLQNFIPAYYLGDKQTAYIEMARASGIQLLDKSQYNPLKTSSIGTGQMLEHAIARGYKNIVLGIGGSATNDGGIGLLSALGYRFLDKSNQELTPTGENLNLIEQIDDSQVLPFKKIHLTIASDVNNPLTGPNGATRIYASQKGASLKDIELLETGMLHYANVCKKHLGIDLSWLPGAGAAGGLGFAAMAFLGGEIISGAEWVCELGALKERINEADLVITGEGSFDHQSMHGKAVMAVARICQVTKTPLVVVCGVNRLTKPDDDHIAIDKVYTIHDLATNTEDAMTNAAKYLRNIGVQIAKDFLAEPGFE